MKYSKFGRRIAAAVLSLAMAAALLPATALAEGDDTSSIGTSTSVETDVGNGGQGSEPLQESGTVITDDTDTTDSTSKTGENTDTTDGTGKAGENTTTAGNPTDTPEETPADQTEEDSDTPTDDGEVGKTPAEDAVAKIGDTKYTTLDEAVAKAEDGATIELLTDATTNGLNLSKDLTITAASGLEKKPTITFTQYGIALRGKALTFKNVDVVMDGIGSTPYTAEWNWMTICASKNASLSLDNTTMTMDGAGAGNKHAIYFCSNNKLNLTNGSVLTILNYQEDALEWDGGDGGYNVNITDSTFISNNNRSGFTGTFYATITNAKVDVINSMGNGSNGSHFIITNSDVNFSNNGSHGLSAGNLSVENSTITANDNGLTGIIFTGKGTFKKSNITITGTKGKSYWNAGMRLYKAAATADIYADTSLTIRDNYVTGLFMDGSTHLNIAEGAKVLITCNYARQENCSTEKELARKGGGIVVRSGAVATLSMSTEIYNNHAALAGDDIFVEDTGTITFGRVGTDWALDGEPDCTDAIDGWYDDPENSRWEAHDPENRYVKEFIDFTDGVATITGVAALKAAHSLFAVEPDDPSAEDWEISKSKTATNLDENFESKVTLSLPSSQQQLVSDVVFVLDKSTSATVENEALSMLAKLKDQIEKTNARVKVGVVIFNKAADVTPLMDLATQYDAIKEAIGKTISGGTNMHAGLLAGKALLDNDAAVDASRKYLILVSDGASYYYCENGDYTTAYTISSLNGGNDGQGNGNCTPNAGIDCWDIKYGATSVPANWETWMQDVAHVITKDYSAYQYVVGSPNIPSENDKDSKGAIPYTSRTSYPVNADISLYRSYQVYQELKETYHCYALTGGSSPELYPYGNSFMNYLADGKTVSFDQIQNDIYYLVDAGSYVEDYIGYAENDYDFDFVNDASALSLKVGEEVYAAQKTADNTYSFKNGQYIVTYVEGNKQDTEHFVWTINVPVSNFAPVQLTYTVKLTNPKTADGTYGTFDADGSKKLDGLYTNLKAILYPIDTNKEQRVPEYFAKPTVSYTVSNAKPVVPTPTPDEHPEIAQAIKDGTWGKTSPTPAPTSKPAAQTARVPQTSDNANPVLWAVVMLVALVALAGVVIARRKSGKD